jgi:hypothetical protein
MSYIYCDACGAALRSNVLSCPLCLAHAIQSGACWRSDRLGLCRRSSGRAS